VNLLSADTLWASLLAVAICGGLGSVARLLLTQWTGWLPWGTLTGNAVASVMVGVALDLALIPGTDDSAALTTALLATGFAGGLSTFSSWAAQTVGLWNQSKKRQAFGYFLATTTGCGLALILGIGLGTFLLK
jgi:CrcB protein